MLPEPPTYHPTHQVLNCHSEKDLLRIHSRLRLVGAQVVLVTKTLASRVYGSHEKRSPEETDWPDLVSFNSACGATTPQKAYVSQHAYDTLMQAFWC